MTSPDRAWIQGLHRASTVYGGTGHGIGSRVRGGAWRSYKSQPNAGWVLDIFYGGSYGVDARAPINLRVAQPTAQIDQICDRFRPACDAQDGAQAATRAGHAKTEVALRDELPVRLQPRLAGFAPID